MVKSTPSLAPGLYVVATPIGNLGDMTLRAIEVLQQASVIACEDSRVTGRLCQRFGIETPLTPYHDHVADLVRPALVRRAGTEAVALVSDAGTPLISDPGYKLVRDCKAARVTVTSIPGACAAVAALCVAGLPSDRFCFAGFLPTKDAARRRALQDVADIPATLIFYESPQRLGESLAAMASVLGDRPACIARELTKLHETLYEGSLTALAARFASGIVKGEVVIVAGPPLAQPREAVDLDALLDEALARAPLKQAVAEVTAATGLPRKQVYAKALARHEG